MASSFQRELVRDKSPMTQTPKRARKKAPKSRQGCSRCKSRRIKCDESHPACQNCTKLGYRCPGFQQPLRWSTKYERLQRTPSGPSNADDTLVPGDQPDRCRQSGSASDLNALPHENDTSRGEVGNVAASANCSWLHSPLATVQCTALDFHQCLDFSDIWDTAFDPNPDCSEALDAQDQLGVMPSPKIMETPTHLPTMLVEHWFGYICPLWSTYDSEISYNRQLAWGSWSTSKAVFYTIQTMSAARLSVSTPYLRDSEALLRSQAVAAVNEAIYLARSSEIPNIQSDLVYAVFTLGNSWDSTTATVPEYPWLESARELLSIWARTKPPLEMPLQAYFYQALTYWEMLMAAAGRGSVPSRLERKRQPYHNRLWQAMGLPECKKAVVSIQSPQCNIGQSLSGTRPNLWSGISNEVIDVLAQVLALCHDVNRYSKDRSGPTTSLAGEVLCNLSVAQDLQRELLAMDFESLVIMDELQGFSVETQDENTPIAHLLQTAQAYRQAALLQLHLAFSDLGMVPRGTDQGSMEPMATDATESIPENPRLRKQYLQSLTLDLVTTLEQIPSLSGSRSIHLILYLCAATGLKFESPCQMGPTSNKDDEREAIQLCSGRDSLWQMHAFSLHPTDLNVPEIFDDYQCEERTTTNTMILRSSLKITRARDLVFTRLSGLQQTLPHRRMDQTLQFVRAMWDEYDSGKADSSSIVHWLDVMRGKGLVITLW